MHLLRNFTIRMVMLVILGIFGLLWSGVGLYSVYSLSKVVQGNAVDRELVTQMTLLSQGNDQSFRFVTRLSRAMETKIAGGNPDFAPAQQALDNMRGIADSSKNIAEITTIMKQIASASAAASALEQQTHALQRSVQQFRLSNSETAGHGLVTSEAV